MDNNNNYENRIFKDKEQKTNLPKGHSMRAGLRDCLAGVKTAILGAPLNECQPNMPPEVWAAGQDLVTLQKERVIVIKPSDKTGGINILPFDAYVKVMGDKLKQTFIAPVCEGYKERSQRPT